MFIQAASFGNPTLVTVTATDSAAGEGTTANTGVFTITRTGSTTNALTVNYTISGTASSTDYNSIASTVIIPAGQASTTVTVTPVNDTLTEGIETVALTLASGTNYTIGTATTVTGTIIDDDTPVIALSLNPTTVAEDGTPNLVYTFTRSGNTSTALTVNYGVSGTATLSTDYVQTGAATFTSTAGSITFAAGASTATLTINPTIDTTVESDETVALTLAPNADYTVGTATAVTGTITNDDVALPSITLAVSPTSVTEDGTANLIYTFTRTGSTTSALTVNYGITGTADSSDYTGATSGTGKTITFAAGLSTATLTIDPTVDTIIESDETVALTLATGTGYTVGTTTAVTGTITNDDFPSINLSANQTIVEGNTNPQNVTYTVTLSSTSPQPITVQYATANGTATAGLDYTRTNVTLTFNPGVTSQVINIPILNDSLNEADETFTLSLSSCL